MAPDRDELLRLKADMRSDDPAVRAAAVARASELIDTTITGVVAEALLSENPEVRARAVALLDIAVSKAE